MTRFLVPYLCNYQGTSIFIDCDMLVKTDILELLPYLGTFHDVAVCQHDYVPKTEIKATGIQTNYPKKNWSSLMVFNNEKCKILTPDYVNSGHPSTLHRFNWAKDIGRIPLEYNWLVGEYDHNDNAKILHYTLGTPCFPEYANCDHSEEWHFEKEILGI
jgi:lipopolysaccharide biosynthesis glycosyltransferase